MICKDCGRELEAKIAPGDLLCPDCRRNRIEKQKLKVLQEQERRLEREEKERKLEEWRRKQKDELDEMKREREARQLEWEQEQEKSRLESSKILDHIKSFEANLETTRTKLQQLDKEEKEEKEKRWAERKHYLDGLSIAQMQECFETSRDERERDYLKQRYRDSISSEDYLELLKNEEKYLEKKKILRLISDLPKKSAQQYILHLEPRWFDEIIEKEGLLKGLVDISPELEDLYAKQPTAKERQKILRINIEISNFNKLSPIEKQIYFREFVNDHSKSIDFFRFSELNKIEDSFERMWMLEVLFTMPALLEPLVQSSGHKPSEHDEELYKIFSSLESLYTEIVTPDEKKEYLEKKQNLIAECKKTLDIHLKNKQEEQNRIEEYQREFEEKKTENIKLIAENKEITKRREERVQLREKRRKQNKIITRIGCAMPLVILLMIGTIIPPNNRMLILSVAAIIPLSLGFVLINAILSSIKMKKDEKNDVADEASQTAITEKCNQLNSRLSELQKNLSK